MAGRPRPPCAKLAENLDSADLQRLGKDVVFGFDPSNRAALGQFQFLDLVVQVAIFRDQGNGLFERLRRVLFDSLAARRCHKSAFLEMGLGVGGSQNGR
jgi:hypothetical protein